MTALGDISTEDEFYPLPRELQDALESFGQASEQLARGGLANVAALAWSACERAAIWLARDQDPDSPRPRTHYERIKVLVRFLKVDYQKVLDLYQTLRAVDAYYDPGRRGQQRFLRLRDAEKCLRIARDVLQRLSAFIPEDQTETLQRGLTEQQEPSPVESTLELVERAVVLGQLASVVDAKLDALLMQYGRPWTRRDVRQAIWVSQLAANRAMQRGHYFGQHGALTLSGNALRLCAQTSEPVQRVHLYTIQSVSYRRLRKFELSKQAIARAYEAAGERHQLRNIIGNQEALLLARAGHFAEAKQKASQLLSQVEAWGDPDLIRRRSLTVGQTLLLAGRFEEAESFLHRGSGGHLFDHVYGQCYSAIAQAYCYERMGLLDKTSQYATVLQQLAQPRHLSWHLRRATVMLARITGKSTPYQEGDEDVF